MRRSSSRRSTSFFFAADALVVGVFALAGGAARGVTALEASADFAAATEAPVYCCITRPASSCCRIGRRLASTPGLFPSPPTTTEPAAMKMTTATTNAAAASDIDCCRINPASSCCRIGRRLASVTSEEACTVAAEAPVDCCVMNPAGSCCRLGRRRLASVADGQPSTTAPMAPTVTRLDPATCCQKDPYSSCCRLGK